MKAIFSTFLLVLCFCLVQAQMPVSNSNSTAEQIMKGNYNPQDYAPTQVVSNRQSIINGLLSDVSADSLKSYLIKLETFHTRNAGSDTTSSTTGIGAARRWLFQKFQQFSSREESRLQVGYLDFEYDICGMDKHRNVYAVLPGMVADKGVVLVEAHFDSRCETRCDVTCYAPGMEDNGSGTALILELARVMSQFAFDRTIIFTTTTAEEHGLRGGLAWSSYLLDNDIDLLACLNNDVIGGVICGEKSSPPSCPFPGHIDSTNVRVFSSSFNLDTNAVSPHKQLARYTKLQQIEEINPNISVPMSINMEIREDRSGRGGDHIPFRQAGFTAIRFTSQNEHGDGTGTGTDRQHSTGDILGVDTSNPPDGTIDSFYVHFNYLARNTMMNGVNLGLMANSPPSPSPAYYAHPNGVKIVLEGSDTIYRHYRVGIRSLGSGSLYFDSVLTFVDTTRLTIDHLEENTTYFFSVMNVEDGIESLFTDEMEALVTGIRTSDAYKGIELLQNTPNPVTDRTTFRISSNQHTEGAAEIRINPLLGSVVKRIPFDLKEGLNEVNFENTEGWQGVYLYSLFIDGKWVQSRKMILTNK